MSGYLNSKNRKKIENSAFISNYFLGKGKIVVFSESTDFRGYWYGTNKFFFNSLYFGDLIDNFY